MRQVDQFEFHHSDVAPSSPFRPFYPLHLCTKPANSHETKTGYDHRLLVTFTGLTSYTSVCRQGKDDRSDDELIMIKLFDFQVPSWVKREA